MRRLTGVLLVGVVGLVLVGLAVAGLDRNFSVHLNGAMEVPIRDTQGQGQAIFRLSKDGSSIEYKLIASNIENVFQAHIHVGPVGENGAVVQWLYPGTSPPAGPTGTGRTDGVLVEGSFTAADFIGPLAGQSLDALLDLMRNGGAYVNVHTNDGVAPMNTGPGDFPGGEIRGDF